MGEGQERMEERVAGCAPYIPASSTGLTSPGIERLTIVGDRGTIHSSPSVLLPDSLQAFVLLNLAPRRYFK